MKKKSTKKSVKSKTTPKDALNDPQKRPSQSKRTTATPKTNETPNPAALEQPSAQNAGLPVNSNVPTPTTSPETQSPDPRAIAAAQSLVLRLGPWVEVQSEPNKLLTEVPQQLSKNQAAFLLGFYIQLPAPDDAIDPLMVVCGVFQTARLTMLDNSLSRLSEYNDELIDFCESPLKLKPEYRDSELLKNRFWAVVTMRGTEIIKVRKIANRLWSGRTELRDWYYVGVAVGKLLLKVAPEESPDSDLAESDDELTSSALDLIRTAADWRRKKQISGPLCKALLDLKKVLLKVRVGHGDSIYKRRELVKEFSELITDEVTSPSTAKLLEDQRDQFIHERMLIHGEYGKDLWTFVNERAKERGWKRVPRDARLLPLARDYARRNGLELPPVRGQGRKRNSEQ